jgi:hypothetical protein
VRPPEPTFPRQAHPTPHLPGVRLHFFHFPLSVLPVLLARQRRRLERGGTGLRSVRLLATSGPGFTNRDFTPRRWLVLAIGDEAADRPLLEPLYDCSLRHCRLDLELTSSRGSWGQAEPFGRPASRGAAPDPPTAIAVLTHARLRPSSAVGFWRAVPPVAGEVARAGGLRLACGIGEAPFLRTGTLSVWADRASLDSFLAGPRHAQVVRRRAAEGWYAEECFARFNLLGIDGDAAVVGGPPGLTGEVFPPGPPA